jgi:hypothetical protein
MLGILAARGTLLMGSDEEEKTEGPVFDMHQLDEALEVDFDELCFAQGRLPCLPCLNCHTVMSGKQTDESFTCLECTPSRAGELYFYQQINKTSEAEGRNVSSHWLHVKLAKDNTLYRWLDSEEYFAWCITDGLNFYKTL